jgi:hypothetical protein
MTKELPQQTAPEWLENMTQENIRERFCLEDILKGSLFYPGCERDASAFDIFSGNYHSFVFADPTVRESDLTLWLNGAEIPHILPQHYRPVASTRLRDSDLSTVFCWDDKDREISRYGRVGSEFVQRWRHLAGSPIFARDVFSTGESITKILDVEIEPYLRLMEKSRDEFASSITFINRRFRYLQEKARALQAQFDPFWNPEPPYAHWFVMEKCDTTAEELPARVSLLFLGEEASLAYRALYTDRGISPAMILIKNWKNGHGDNRPWSRGDVDSSPFYKAVTECREAPMPDIAFKIYQEEPDWEGWEEFAKIPLDDNYRGEAPLRLLRHAGGTLAK